MTLAGGDLTTPQRVATWISNPPTLPSPVQLIGSMTKDYGKLNRSDYNQPFTPYLCGCRYRSRLIIPPLASSVQQGSLIPASAYPGRTRGVGRVMAIICRLVR